MDGNPLNVPPTLEDSGTVDIAYDALQKEGLCKRPLEEIRVLGEMQTD